MRNILIIAVVIIAFFAGLLIGKSYFNQIPNLNLISKSCQYNGNTYKSGEGFKAADGCNSCSCVNGQVACTLMACQP